jgi:hypothetical protein
MNLLQKLNLEPGHMVFERLDDKTVNVTRRSLFSGKVNTMRLAISEDQQSRYQDPHGHELIQNIFPNLTTDEREFLMSGATPDEWDATFPEEEE